MSMNKQAFPIWNYFPIQVPIELPRTVSPTTVRLMDDRTNFVQEEPLVLQYWSMIWATCVSVDVSKNQIILTL